jgi:hypothetical protein
VVAGEKALKSNILVYFEDLQERAIEECVQQYFLKLQNDMKQRMLLAPTMQPRQEPHEQPALKHRSPYRIMPPSPSPLQYEKEDD